jgi:hypothetical protein
VSTAEVTKLIESSPVKSCSLDPLPTQLLKKCLVVLVGPITDIINLSLSTGAFPSSLKHGIITPLLKKPTLDRNVLSNFRPVSNLSFLSKLIQRAVLMLLTEHLSKFSLLPVHQSAYRANHSTETALLYLFDDLLTTADQKDATCPLLLTQSITKYCLRDCPTVSVFPALLSTGSHHTGRLVAPYWLHLSRHCVELQLFFGVFCVY